MRAGLLRHRIVIEQPVESRGAKGEVLVNWVAVCSVWAEIQPMSVNALIASQAAQSKASVMIKIRFRSGITAKMRARELPAGGVYPLEGDPLPDKQSGKEYLTLACSRGINDGR